MKKTILFLTLSLLTLGSVSAVTGSTTSEKVRPSIKIIQDGDNYNEAILFEFETIDEMEIFDLSTLDDFFDYTRDDCSVTATVTVSHTLGMEGNVGVASTGHKTTISVSATVTASCSEIKSVIKALIADLRAQLGI
ncbi:hypothetical protein [Muriicola sp. Z0-33]|uniref:hypothetical protein n=1 Tax=Muriicola sp. Z0-33 TaxID=2816957 RepID=UPI002238C6BF|nr:hypothetical protein [Muriicola sp. Z0-33]MCW5518009.1 hypothetical protein [Muriicola sp. Z0-33]